jgi:cellulose synthase (UDP-forming)
VPVLVRNDSSRLSALPLAPTDDEKWLYAKRRHRGLAVASWLSVAGVLLSLSRFAVNARWTLVLFAYVVATAGYIVVNQATSWRGCFDVDAHCMRVASWRPSSYPSVDVFWPTCGEDLDVLINAANHIAQLRWPGKLTVWCLDDAGRAEVEQLAESRGFSYSARPTHELKKAGNLRYAFERSEGELIAIYDADFCPRPEMLLELAPYMDDASTSIVGSPQFFDATYDTQNWLQAAAGSVQELFYRSIQVARDHLGAPICVGTNALYRRAALQPFGGTAPIEHSEDVHTGVATMSNGWRVRYVPVVLAKGICPDGMRSFFAQQYRWCAGSMSLLRSQKFTQSRMSLMQRLCFVSGFTYYAHTAVSVLVIPLIPLSMIWLFPSRIQLSNYLTLLPALAYSTVLFPRWHNGRYRTQATARTRIIAAWAHLFAIVDTLRGNLAGWQPTGAAAKVATPMRKRFVAFREIFTLWNGVTIGGTALGLILRVGAGQVGWIAAAPLVAFTAVAGWNAYLIHTGPGVIDTVDSVEGKDLILEEAAR